MKEILTFILLLILFPPIFAQNVDNDKFDVIGGVFSEEIDSSSSLQSQKTYRQLEQTEVSFLFSYYEQEGNNSAVTGGTGSEELHDLEFGAIINIPLDSLSTLKFNTGLTSYTSASNDRINFRVSSASKHEFRGRIDATYTRQQPQKRQYYGLSAGFSGEVDYISSSIWRKMGDYLQRRKPQFRPNREILFRYLGMVGLSPQNSVSNVGQKPKPVKPSIYHSFIHRSSTEKCKLLFLQRESIKVVYCPHLSIEYSLRMEKK